MPNWYVLNEQHDLVPEPDFLKAAEFFEDMDNRRVALHVIGDSEVSTVFLGLDHNFRSDGPPLLFETLVTGGPLDQRMERYSSWSEAVAGHFSYLRILAEATGKSLEEILRHAPGAPGSAVPLPRTLYDRLLGDEDA